MTRSVLFFLLLFIFNLIPEAYSQQKSKKEEYFDDGVYFYAREDYKEAAYQFSQLLKYDSTNANFNYKLGMCYLNIPGEETKAIPYLEKAVKNTVFKYKEKSFTEKQAPLHALFYLGNAYRINNELGKALEMYNKFISSPEFYGNYNYSMVNNEIEACERAKIIKDKPVDVTFVNPGAPVNTSSAETKAVRSFDGQSMVFVRSLKFYDALFYSKWENNNWSEPENITPLVGSDGEAYPSGLSSDGTTLYLISNKSGNKDIYTSELKNGKWQQMKPLNEEINTRQDETHASISSDGKMLYFASSRRKGEGKLDIWVSKKLPSGSWGEPENLGETINTDLDEDTPFISPDGNTLYFCSKGHYNMGGFDIFYSIRDKNGKWTEPVNIGYPVNTTNDNVFYQPAGNSHSGITYRIRTDGYGDEDIWMVEFPEK
jgi:ribosomal protein L24E